MIIIVGLGNPGHKFYHTRHNIGFMVIDEFAKKNNFGNFLLSKKYKALISKKDNIILAKPQTFMNDSGKSAALLMKGAVNDKMLIIVHDDVDIILGNIKFSKDSGSGGHKGVDSIIRNLGHKNFIRLKIGVGVDGPKIKAEKIVLKKFTPAEQKTINKVIKKSVKAIEYLIFNGLEKAMNLYH